MSPGASLSNRDRAKPVSMNMIDKTVFLRNLDNIAIPTSIQGQSNDDAIKHVTDVLYQNAMCSRREARTQDMNNTLERWERILQNNDDLNMWKAIK